MNKIHLLSLHEAQKIAAGEVIDRPAHCIKELVENSLDAGATFITVECKQAGKELILISDNGCGMSPDDLLISYHRHTTSKITSCDDLQSLTTFGFRGEALASICSVARMTFVTRTEEQECATELVIEDQRIISQKPVARVVGTTISVENLFNTIPARKKFLKKDSTEWNQCLSILKSFIAQNKVIHFIVKHDGYLVFNCPPVSYYKDRLIQLYGSLLENHVNELELYSQKGIRIEGAITNSSYGRFDKSGMFIFVNKRLVKNYHLVKAVLQGYQNSLQTGKFPAVIISITLDPRLIDVNIHPKKEEILFEFPHQIDAAVVNAIRQTLHQAQKQSIVPDNKSHFLDPVFSVSFAAESNSLPLSQVPARLQSNDNLLSSTFSFNMIQSYPVESAELFDDTSTVLPDLQGSLEIIPHDYTIVGVYKRTYIMAEDYQGLLVLDQHAVHERMLYNKWVLNHDSFETVGLLFPITFSLLQEEIEALNPYLQVLQHFGIVFEQQGPSLFKVASVPVFLKNESIELVVREVLSWIYQEKSIVKEDLYHRLTEKLRTLIACKTAVKAGDKIDDVMITELVNYFYTSDNCFTCPHGRPVSWRLSLSELEKKFKRDYR